MAELSLEKRILRGEAEGNFQALSGAGAGGTCEQEVRGERTACASDSDVFEEQSGRFEEWGQHAELILAHIARSEREGARHGRKLG